MGYMEPDCDYLYEGTKCEDEHDGDCINCPKFTHTMCH